MAATTQDKLQQQQKKQQTNSPVASMPNFDDDKIHPFFYFIRYLFRLTAKGWFRQISIQGDHTTPSPGEPVLFLGTHCNMAVDGVIVGVNIPHNRPVHFWAKDNLYRMNKFVAWFMNGIGALPVDRAHGENSDLFVHTVKCLKQGGVIGAFPEGTSYTLPSMMDIKDGPLWSTMYFFNALNKERIENSNVEGFVGSDSDEKLVIVPIGVVYTDKSKWRSSVVVHYGKPIRPQPYAKEFLAAETAEDKKKAVKALKAEVLAALKSLTINANGIQNTTENNELDGAHGAWAVHRAAFLARDIMFESSGRSIELRDYVWLSQAYIDAIERHVPSSKQLAAAFDALGKYHALLAANGFRDQDIALIKPTPAQQAAADSANGNGVIANGNHSASQSVKLAPIDPFKALQSFLVRFGRFAVELPVLLPLVAFHAPIFYVTKKLGNLETYEECIAQTKCLVMIVFTGLTYSIAGLLLWGFVGGFSLLSLLVFTALLPWVALAMLHVADARYEVWKSLYAEWRLVKMVSGWQKPGTVGNAADGAKKVQELIQTREDVRQLVLAAFVESADELKDDKDIERIADYWRNSRATHLHYALW